MMLADSFLVNRLNHLRQREFNSSYPLIVKHGVARRLTLRNAKDEAGGDNVKGNGDRKQKLPAEGHLSWSYRKRGREKRTHI